jgi:hypothetical protein
MGTLPVCGEPSYIYVYIYIYIHVYKYLHICMYIYIRISMRVQLQGAELLEGLMQDGAHGGSNASRLGLHVCAVLNTPGTEPPLGQNDMIDMHEPGHEETLSAEVAALGAAVEDADTQAREEEITDFEKSIKGLKWATQICIEMGLPRTADAQTLLDRAVERLVQLKKQQEMKQVVDITSQEPEWMDMAEGVVLEENRPKEFCNSP